MKKNLLLLAAAGLALAGFRSPAAEFNQRLANLSTRTQVGSGANIAVVGFVVGPGSPKNVLIRAIGPGLASLGVAGANTDPRIDLYAAQADGSSRLILANDNWNTTVAPAGAANAATFSAVGAFGLTNNSRDAALLATLAPGSYTAQVSGVGTANGIALLEVYDVSGAARLMNLSTRANVGTGAGILISGISIAADNGRRQILVRAAGPALAAFGVQGAISDPTIAIIDGTNNQIASNDNWDENAASLSAAFAKSGAFAFAAGSKDAAVITDLAPGNYTIQVSGVNGATGGALVEVYDITPDQLPTVTVAATNPTTDTRGGAPGVYTIARTGTTTSPLTVYLSAGGTALAGFDYTALPGSVTIPAGASSVTLNLAPRTDGATDAISRSATVALVPGAGYSIGAASVASVTIFYNPGTNYIASLRAPASATASTAFGTATIQLSGDGAFAMVNVNFSNLSSPQTVAYLRYGNPGEVGSEILRLPNGQVTGVRWDFGASGALTSADLVNALKDGRIFLSIESATYPAGELRGAFIQNSATLLFAPPVAPPALADGPLTATEVSRFLTQTTFGPTRAEIDALTGKRLADLNNWITTQLAARPSLHLDAVDDDFRTYTAVGENPQYSQQNRQAAWWKLSLTAPDQLRQRVAFALSQIFVVSDVNGTLFNNARSLSNYYDILVRGASGNFRQILEEVTRSPIMGVYLSHLRNGKATFNARGELVTYPDENYAREIMQLFTIGLNQLQPDGTLRLDPTGLPIPTYDNKTITEMAKVFTGWAFSSDTTNANNFRGAATNYLAPMVVFPTFHETGAKTIFNGIQLPANQPGEKDLKDTLDALFNHANTAPFISRQLIQRLVTSNPSPGYVHRVAQAFADNGSGVRGDMTAVVRAVLMDYEARSGAVAATASFGKLREPLLRVTALLRAFGATANTGRYAIFNPEGNLAQAALRAQTVFNFFEPYFVQPGVLAAAGLYAPEYQIMTDTTAISVPNQLWTYVYSSRSGAFGGATAANLAETTVGFSWDNSMLALARTPQVLVDQLNLLLAGGGLPKAITDRIVTAINAMPANTATTYNTSDLERLRSAIYLTVSIPQGAIQK
ncbi:MAG: DUF1800 family protein [Verrucomicrobia bacterium]|nr:DUF1800 family protein [Verrucomicrobiota bacterium]